jgi:hypothetical protein
LVAKFKYNAENNSYTCPRETLKPQEDGIKVGEQNKAGINLKIQNPSLQAMFRKTPLYH